MRILLTVLLQAGILTTSFSQYVEAITVRPNGTQTSKRDTIIQPFKDQKKNQLPYSGIPNAITVKPLPPVYSGNNGRGFDIYDSRVDNMPILMPDSSFVSNMPIAQLGEGKKVKGEPAYTIPGSGLRNFLEQYKQKDTVSTKPWQPKIYRIPKK